MTCKEAFEAAIKEFRKKMQEGFDPALECYQDEGYFDLLWFSEASLINEKRFSYDKEQP